ncbi:hypothetical protein HAX54_028223, partial [Datura stramonium]|nr:hypothetical protein [Datura stramonium]
TRGRGYSSEWREDKGIYKTSLRLSCVRGGVTNQLGDLRGGGLPYGGCQQDGITLEVKGEVQTRKGLRWIPRHPEMRKCAVIDEMLWGVENKHRSGDSRIGQPFELLLNPWQERDNLVN